MRRQRRHVAWPVLYKLFLDLCVPIGVHETIGQRGALGIWLPLRGQDRWLFIHQRENSLMDKPAWLRDRAHRPRFGMDDAIGMGRVLVPRPTGSRRRGRRQRDRGRRRSDGGRRSRRVGRGRRFRRRLWNRGSRRGRWQQWSGEWRLGDWSARNQKIQGRDATCQCEHCAQLDHKFMIAALDHGCK